MPADKPTGKKSAKSPGATRKRLVRQAKDSPVHELRFARPEHPAAFVERDKSFEVCCEPPDHGRTFVATAGICASIRQRIRANDLERMWESAIIRCIEESDGTLAVRVFVSNPDWDERLQIACIRSWPNDPASMTALGCNLDHVSERDV